MRDMFDEFMEELRKRAAEQRARGGEPSAEGDAEPPTEGDEVNEPRSEEPLSHADDGSDDEDRIRRPNFGRGGQPPFRRRGGFGSDGDIPSFSFGIGRGWLILLIVVFVALPLITGFLTFGVSLWTDAIWYQSVGFAGVFWTRFWSQVGFFVIGVLVAFAFLAFNVWLPSRFYPRDQLRHFSLDDFLERMSDRFTPDRYPGSGPFGARAGRVPAAEMIEIPDFGRPMFWVLLVIAALIALGLGGAMAGGWSTIQLWLHQVSFGQQDPVFHRDIGFFVFELPFFRLLQSFVNNLLLVAFALAAIRYVAAVVAGAKMTTPARLHLGLLFGLFLISVAAGYQLDKLELVYSNQGVATGVSYTDANARFFALDAVSIIAAFAGAFIVLLALTRMRWPLVATVFVWGIAYIGLVQVYPQLVQTLQVKPNQQNLEAPYITNNINMTRLAFNLGGWSASQYTPDPSVQASDIASEPATLQNVRLWDYRPLQTTLDQLQVIRKYYGFNDVDTDRYTFADASSCSPAPAPCQRQVMLAGRELNYAQVDQSWVNQHLTYTHGIGLAMVPVNEVVPGSGQPRLLISNLPPSSTGGAPVVKKPQIYFGTQSMNYVIVDAASDEFDYPASTGQSSDTMTRWTGETGIKLDNTLLRLLFAARFGDLNMLISNQITGSSQLLFHQSITERVGLIAPFLRYDKDPYLVVTKDGGLAYVLDAFTTTSAFPNAQSYDPNSEVTGSGLSGDSFNYVRNSVKVVMNAYDGSMSFYVADPNDPIIRAYSGVFPGTFKPISEMPSDIRAHIRYPEDLLNAQTTMYERYHVTDPGVFYQGNDLWQVARTSDNGQSGSPQQLQLEAYYVIMRMPNVTQPEFLLLQPMVPQQRPNMIAWVAARNDGENYGQVKVFDFPRDSSVFGPQQMEGLFAQNRDISQQITLWSQQGSTVILGNLLVVPLQTSILYIEPVYLQSTNNPLPIFQKVIVATPSQIVWGDTLDSAVSQILAGKGASPGGGGASPSPGASPTPSPSASPTPSPTGVVPTLPPNATAQQLLAEASRHYDLAQQALAAKDLATYQKEMDQVGLLVRQASQLLGTPAP